MPGKRSSSPAGKSGPKRFTLQNVTNNAKHAMADFQSLRKGIGGGSKKRSKSASAALGRGGGAGRGSPTTARQPPPGQQQQQQQQQRAPILGPDPAPYPYPTVVPPPRVKHMPQQPQQAATVTGTSLPPPGSATSTYTGRSSPMAGTATLPPSAGIDLFPPQMPQRSGTPTFDVRSASPAIATYQQQPKRKKHRSASYTAGGVRARPRYEYERYEEFSEPQTYGRYSPVTHSPPELAGPGAGLPPWQQQGVPNTGRYSPALGLGGKQFAVSPGRTTPTMPQQFQRSHSPASSLVGVMGPQTASPIQVPVSQSPLLHHPQGVPQPSPHAQPPPQAHVGSPASIPTFGSPSVGGSQPGFSPGVVGGMVGASPQMVGGLGSPTAFSSPAFSSPRSQSQPLVLQSDTVHSQASTVIPPVAFGSPMGQPTGLLGSPLGGLGMGGGITQLNTPTTFIPRAASPFRPDLGGQLRPEDLSPTSVLSDSTVPRSLPGAAELGLGSGLGSGTIGEASIMGSPMASMPVFGGTLGGGFAPILGSPMAGLGMATIGGVSIPPPAGLPLTPMAGEASSTPTPASALRSPSPKAGTAYGTGRGSPSVSQFNSKLGTPTLPARIDTPSSAAANAVERLRASDLDMDSPGSPSQAASPRAYPNGWGSTEEPGQQGQKVSYHPLLPPQPQPQPPGPAAGATESSSGDSTLEAAPAVGGANTRGQPPPASQQQPQQAYSTAPSTLRSSSPAAGKAERAAQLRRLTDNIEAMQQQQQLLLRQVELDEAPDSPSSSIPPPVPVPVHFPVQAAATLAGFVGQGELASAAGHSPRSHGHVLEPTVGTGYQSSPPFIPHSNGMGTWSNTPTVPPVPIIPHSHVMGSSGGSPSYLPPIPIPVSPEHRPERQRAASPKPEATIEDDTYAARPPAREDPRMAGSSNESESIGSEDGLRGAEGAGHGPPPAGPHSPTSTRTPNASAPSPTYRSTPPTTPFGSPGSNYSHIPAPIHTPSSHQPPTASPLGSPAGTVTGEGLQSLHAVAEEEKRRVRRQMEEKMRAEREEWSQKEGELQERIQRLEAREALTVSSQDSNRSSASGEA